MRTKYVRQVNQEIAVKNREHGITSRAIDINQLVNREKPITWKSAENPVRNYQAERAKQPAAGREEQSRLQTPARPAESGTGASRIKKEDRNAPSRRATTAPSRAAEPASGNSRIQKQDKSGSSSRGNDVRGPASRSSGRVEPGRSEPASEPSRSARPSATTERERPDYGPNRADLENERPQSADRKAAPAPQRQPNRAPNAARVESPERPPARTSESER